MSHRIQSTQNTMIQFYINQYNQTLRRINYLYGTLEEINNNLTNAYRISTNNQTRDTPISISSNENTIPTSEQISQATSIIRYNSLEHLENISCPISLEIFNDNDHVSQIHFCGHLFNTTHLSRWFQQSSKCPICRYDICNNNNNNNNNNTENDHRISEDFNIAAERMIIQLLEEMNGDTTDYSLDASNNTILSNADRNNLFSIFQNNYM